MPTFVYKIVNNQGKRIKGSLEAESKEVLVETLQKQGFIVLTVKEASSKALRHSLLRPKIKTKELLILFSQLAAMLEAGIPLITALQGLNEEIENKRLKGILSSIIQEISQGASFAEALAKMQIFDPLVVTLVKTGETSGQLDISLNQLVSYLEEINTLKQQIKSALTYPIFLILFATMAILFLLTKIVPIFAKIYARFKFSLPLPTRILLGISHAIGQNILFILGGILALISLFLGLKRNKDFQIQLDALKLRLPLVGPLIKKTALARFATSFAILIKSGVPLVSTLRLVRNVVQNKIIELGLDEVIISVEKGDSLAEALKKTRLFPGLVIQMTATGEKTGMLDAMLEKVARFYEEQVKLSTRNLTTMLEPIMIIFLGGIIGFILLSVFLPIFKLGQIVRG